MKKKLFSAALTVALLFGATTTLSAQDFWWQNGNYSNCQISLFTPIGTNGMQSSRFTNDVSINLLVGVSRNERAFAFGGLSNIILHNAKGVQFAGLANYTGGRGHGVQFAGLMNLVRGNYRGVQFGGLFNISCAGTRVHFTGLANIANGVQFAGLFNTAQKFNGVQFAGLFNVARNFHGMQFGGVFNAAGNVQGIQIASLLNIARNVHGVQFGLVNIARRSDTPIGLINISREGEKSIAVSYDELGTLSLAFRSGGRALYGIVGAGYNFDVPDHRDPTVVFGGLGAHINVERWFRIDNELTFTSLDCFRDDHSTTFKTGYALLPAFRAGRHFEIFGGPSINYMQSDDALMYNLFPDGGYSLWDKQNGSKRQEIYVGWQAGVKFIF